jgi:hypothetical protein
MKKRKIPSVRSELKSRFGCGAIPDLLIRAGLLALAYAMVNLAGWRTHTRFLSGTMSEGADLQSTAIRGLLYALSHIGFWVLMPVLLIAAGLVRLWPAVFRERPPADAA